MKATKMEIARTRGALLRKTGSFGRKDVSSDYFQTCGASADYPQPTSCHHYPALPGQSAGTTFDPANYRSLVWGLGTFTMISCSSGTTASCKHHQDCPGFRSPTAIRSLWPAQHTGELTGDGLQAGFRNGNKWPVRE